MQHAFRAHVAKARTAAVLRTYVVVDLRSGGQAHVSRWLTKLVKRSSSLHYMLLSESMLKCHMQRGFDASAAEVVI